MKEQEKNRLLKYHTLTYRESLYFVGKEIIALILNRTRGFDDDRVFHLRNVMSSLKCYFFTDSVETLNKEIRKVLNPEASRPSFGKLRLSKGGITLYGGNFSPVFSYYRTKLPYLLEERNLFTLDPDSKAMTDALLEKYREGTEGVSKYGNFQNDLEDFRKEQLEWLYNLLDVLSNAYYIQSCKYTDPQEPWTFRYCELIEMYNQLSEMEGFKPKSKVGRYNMETEDENDPSYPFHEASFVDMEEVIHILELIVIRWLHYSDSFSINASGIRTLVFWAMEAIEKRILK